MRKSGFILLFWTLLHVTSAAAQVQVRGVVRDADTGEALPGATIQIEGAFQGAVSNADGRFFLVVSRIPAVLIVRHIGFRTVRVDVAARQIPDLTIELNSVSLELEELVVSGEDPAVGIMRRVLERKRAFRSTLTSTYAEVYTRFWLYREFEPIQVIESVRSAYWRNGQGSRELTRARRIRPGASGTFRFAEPQYVPNFYDDEVVLQGTRYATPTHPDAVEIYQFRLGAKRMIDDSVVWDIYFSPKSPTRTAFTGHVAVVDSVFEILEMDVRQHPVTVVTPPVQVNDVRYTQRFVRLASGIVVPLDLTAHGYLAFGQLGASYPPARYEQVSGISNYAIDVATPDSMFSDERMQREHPLVDRSDYLFVRNPTIVPLTPRESEDLAGLNPKMTIDRAFRAEGLLAMYTAVRVTEEEEEEEQTMGGPVGLILDHAWGWYNRVDGVQAGLFYRLPAGEYLDPGVRIGYSAARKEVSAGADLSVPWQIRTVSGSVFVDASTGSAPAYQASRYDQLSTGVMTYLGYDDYFDYLQKDQVRFGVRIGAPKGPLAVSIAGALEQHTSLEKTAKFDGWLFKNVQRDNPAIEEGHLASVQVEMDAGWDQLDLSARLEHASSGFLSSDFDFSTVSGTVSWSFATFFRSRDRPNQLHLSLVGATSRGSLPRQRYALLDGSTGFHSVTSTFRTLQDRAVVGTRVAAIFWEHDFTTGLMERLGLWGLAEQGTGFILFGGHGKVWDVLDARPGDGAYHEIGLGLAYPFRLPLRVDVAARLDQQGFSVTLGRASH